MKKNRSISAIATFLAAGLLTAGCNSDNGSETTETGATGSPILIGQILPIEAGGLSVGNQAAAMIASIDAFNARGGVGGRPLQLLQCDSTGDPNKEIDCAHKMVSEGAVATLADFTPTSSVSVSDVLSGAGIPRIGMNPVHIVDFSAPNVFTPFSGSLLTLFGAIDTLVAQGKTKLTLMRPDVPVAAMLTQLLEPALKAKGAEIVNDVAVGTGATDYTQFIAAAERNDAQGVVMALSATDSNPIAESFSQLGSKLAFGLAATGFSQDDLQDLGGFATSSVYTSSVPAPSSSTKDFPGLEPFLADMDKSGEKDLEREKLNGTELYSWLAVRAFGEVANNLTSVNHNTVTQGFQDAEDLDMLGLVPNWTPGAVEPFGFFQRVSNTMMYRMSFDGETVNTDLEQYDLRTS